MFCCFLTVHEHHSKTITLRLKVLIQRNATWTKHIISFLSKHETFAANFSLFRATLVCRRTQFRKPFLQHDITRFRRSLRPHALERKKSIFMLLFIDWKLTKMLSR